LSTFHDGRVLSLHGEADDPVGDATPNPGLARAPDLVYATVDAADRPVHFFVRFTAGTLDLQATGSGRENR